jgi:hypothetical protein
MLTAELPWNPFAIELLSFSPLDIGRLSARPQVGRAQRKSNS